MYFVDNVELTWKNSVIAQNAAMNINLLSVKTVVPDSRCGNFYPHTFAEIGSRRSVVDSAVT